MYNISQGIFLVNKNQSKQRQLSVGHSEKVRERFKYAFPKRYTNFTKENFILTCLYINFSKSPSSFDRFLEILKELDFNTSVLPFKNSIVNYKHFIGEDVNYLKSTYGKPTIEQMFTEYSNHKIHFYTLWFYIRFQVENIDDYKYSNIQQIIINKVKIILLYITFSEESLAYIKSLFNESSILA
jgi:hypothetical protein